MYCSPPGSSVHGALQVRRLECFPFPPSGDLPNPGIEPASLMCPALAGEFFTTSATWEAQTINTVNVHTLSYQVKYWLERLLLFLKSPCLFNLCAEYVMRNAGLDEAQAGIKIAGRNINKLRFADDTTLMAESEEELKSLLKMKEESGYVGLKLNVQKTKIMASGPITSWQIDAETMETVTDFILGGSEITADGDCRHEIKRHLLLGRKAMTNLDSILKSRDITLPTKVSLVKVMVFPIVMYGCESWTIKKAERQRIDAFELGCWRTSLVVQ